MRTDTPGERTRTNPANDRLYADIKYPARYNDDGGGGGGETAAQWPQAFVMLPVADKSSHHVACICLVYTVSFPQQT